MKRLFVCLALSLFALTSSAVELKQSTQIEVRVGPFVDVTDGYTPETGITLSGADEAELLKADGAATVDISGATWSAVSGSDGWYDLTLTTSHTDTLGELVVVVQDDSTCLPVFMRFSVVTDNWWDSKYGTDELHVDIVSLATAAEAEIADAVWDEATAGHVAAGSFGLELQGKSEPGDAMDLVAGAVDAAAIAADAIGSSELATTAVNEIRDAILSDSTPFAGANIDATISSRATPAQVNTEVDTALADIGLDHLLAAAVAGTDITDDSIIAQLVSSAATADWDTFDNTTDSLQAIADSSSNPPTAAAIADAVLLELVSDHSGTVGSLAYDIDRIFRTTRDRRP